MKRSLALILSIVMLMGIFAACSSSNNNNDTSANVPADNDNKGGNNDDAAPADDGLIPSSYGGVAVTPPGELPIVKEPVTLKILIAQHENVEDYEDNKMTKFMEEQTGVDIEWVMVPSQ
ncbi:MAG: hypothetical protein GX957_16470, partial [Clostridiaceae bacterium]|nr:hypothetical protein [Clostridiaceae bacterium]